MRRLNPVGFQGYGKISQALKAIPFTEQLFCFPIWHLAADFWRILKPGAAIILGAWRISEGALNLKKEKRNSSFSVAKTLGLYKNILWHASSDFEAADIRRVMGSNVKIHVAIDIASPKAEMTLKERWPGAPLRIVFVSRISPRKTFWVPSFALKENQKPGGF